MTTVFIDTNAYVAFKRGTPAVLDVLHRAQHICLSSIVVGELMAGFVTGTRTDTNIQELQQFLAIAKVSVTPVDAQTSIHYAHIYRQLRTQGRPIPSNDLWIAATTIQHHGRLLSFDQHFSHIEGLIVGDSAHPLGLQ